MLIVELKEEAATEELKNILLVSQHRTKTVVYKAETAMVPSRGQP